MKFAELKHDISQQVQQWSHDYPSIRSLPYWLAAIVVGLIAVGYAKLYEWVGEKMLWFLHHHPYQLFLLAPLLFVAGWWIVQKYAPAAAGSGIPQVMAALQKGAQVPEKELSRLLGFRVMLVKIVSSLLCLLGGGVIGREGPTIQIGASIFCSVHRRFGNMVHQHNPMPWIIAGSSAGLAAAFNTPLGGIVFAIEELASVHFNQFKIAVLSAVIIAGMIAQSILGPYLYLGFFKVIPQNYLALGWMVLVAIFCGAAGAYFGRILTYGSRTLRHRSMRVRLSWAAVCGLLVVSMGILSHAKVLYPGSKLVGEILTSPDSVLSWPMVFARYLAMIFSYLSGCAGGIFAPSLSMGAELGAQLARAFGVVDVNLMTLTGMTAFLAAVTRVPFTAAVLVLEMTDRHGAVFPVMCAAMVAYAVSFLIDRESFYRRQMRYYYQSSIPEHSPVEKLS